MTKPANETNQRRAMYSRSGCRWESRAEIKILSTGVNWISGVQCPCLKYRFPIVYRTLAKTVEHDMELKKRSHVYIVNC